CAMRDRLVVRSSVIPSAKYCWSVSLPRLAKGSTTIDIRGATRCCAVDVAVAVAGVGDGFVVGQGHHAVKAATITAPTAGATPQRKTRLRSDGLVGAPEVGSGATNRGAASLVLSALPLVSEPPSRISATGCDTEATKR